MIFASSFSGTARKTKAAPARMMPPKIVNVARQPTSVTRKAVGSVAMMMPRAPADMMQALASERRSIGTQMEDALKLAINPAEKPSPIMAREATSERKSGAAAKRKQPAAAMARSTVCTRLAP